MRLTDYTDYSLRTLIYLGLHRDELTTVQHIAEVYDISRTHLMKVVHQLGIAGLVETIRGRTGGLRLKIEPEDICLGDVVRRTEPDFMMAKCFDRKNNSCILSTSCELQHVLRQATAAYLEVLDGVTLAQLLKNNKRLTKLTRIHFYPPQRKAA